jgi:HEAT repeat protein
MTALLRRLSDDEWRVRRKAAEALGQAGAAAGEAVPALTRLLDDSSREVRAAAAESLGRMGPAAEAAVPALIRRLTTDPGEQISTEADWAKERLVQVHAADALKRVGAGAVPALIRSLADRPKERVVRTMDGMEPAWRQRPETQAIVSLLIQKLVDRGEKVRVRTDVAQVLGAIGPEARAAVSALIRLLADPADFLPGGGEFLQEEVKAALDRVDPSWPRSDAARAIVATLIQRLEDPDRDVSDVAARVLGRLGPAAEAAVPALTRLLTNEDELVRNTAEQALTRIKKTPPTGDGP